MQGSIPAGLKKLNNLYRINFHSHMTHPYLRQQIYAEKLISLLQNSVVPGKELGYNHLLHPLHGILTPN